ncbi:MAG: radical SAM protein [Candidatus Pacearchaeota archaeon]|jgi:radical SAM superfamily enzyme
MYKPKIYYIITPKPDKNYFKNKFNLPCGEAFIPNLTALFYASELNEKWKRVEYFDYYDEKMPIINKKDTQEVHLFLGYANYNNGLKLKKQLETKGIKVFINGIYNFIDGQNFSDISVLKERGIDSEKPVVSMDVKLNYDLLKSLPRLFKLQKQFGERKFLAVISQYYGCPKKLNCLHCNSDKVNWISCSVKLTKMPNEVIEEIIDLKRKYNLDMVILGDLMNTEARLKSLYETYQERSSSDKIPILKISTAANYVNEKSIKYLKGLNCKEVFLGLETYNENLLIGLDKPFRVEDINRSLNLLYESKISAFISIILGVPGETEETLNRTLNFVNEWKSKQIDGKPFLKLQVTIVTPVPGSGLWKLFKSKNGVKDTLKLVESKDWIHKIQVKYLNLFFTKKVQRHILDVYNKLNKFAESSYVNFNF